MLNLYIRTNMNLSMHRLDLRAYMGTQRRNLTTDKNINTQAYEENTHARARAHTHALVGKIVDRRLLAAFTYPNSQTSSRVQD